jgi:formylglycine-generating enzyme required for sulfatase activity
VNLLYWQKKKLEAREDNNSADLNKNLRKNLIGMTFTYIPPGQFLMGASSEEVENAEQSKKIGYLKDETPQHQVTIKNGFWLSITEVTQEQWESVMGNNPSTSKSSNCPKCPVETVSWNDAKEFIRKLNEKNDEFEYRLPTEAEWEYAARAGTTTVFAFGNSLDSNQANFNGESPYGKDVKSIFKGKPDLVRNYEPNAFGPYDMHGNVSEWCEDIYTENFNSLPTDGSANLKGDPKKRVIRGGSWIQSGFNCRSANRDPWDFDQKFSNIGFRVAAQLKNQ